MFELCDPTSFDELSSSWGGGQLLGWKFWRLTLAKGGADAEGFRMYGYVDFSYFDIWRWIGTGLVLDTKLVV